MKEYKIEHTKVSRELTILFAGDLHCTDYGENNRELILLCAKQRPDLILLSGDMITAGTLYPTGVTIRFLEGLRSIAPVIGVNGNHETKNRVLFPEHYQYYSEKISEAGICVLNNESRELTVNGQKICAAGLELPLDKYKKFRHHDFNSSDAAFLVGKKDKEAFQILLAHNPQFVPGYLSWGADLALCGHFHGGVMRLPGHRVLLSPYGFPLPKYGYGHFKDSHEHHAIVTAGLGEHAIPFRICNPLEIVVIRLRPRR